MLDDLGAVVVVELDLVLAGEDVGGLPAVAVAEVVLDLADPDHTVAADPGDPDPGGRRRLEIQLAPA